MINEQKWTLFLEVMHMKDELDDGFCLTETDDALCSWEMLQCLNTEH